MVTSNMFIVAPIMSRVNSMFQKVVLRRVRDKENLKCKFADRLMMRKLGKPGGGTPINTWLVGMDMHPTLPSP